MPQRVKKKHGTKMYDKMLVYDFDLHKWIYDAKFYLIDSHWHISPDGGTIVGDLTSNQEQSIFEYQSDVDTQERKYQIEDQIQVCRKRTCPCKKCERVFKCKNGCLECFKRGITVNVGICTEVSDFSID